MFNLRRRIKKKKSGEKYWTKNFLFGYPRHILLVIKSITTEWAGRMAPLGKEEKYLYC
jgi:hypothetical protein